MKRLANRVRYVLLGGTISTNMLRCSSHLVGCFPHHTWDRLADSKRRFVSKSERTYDILKPSNVCLLVLAPFSTTSLGPE